MQERKLEYNRPLRVAIIGSGPAGFYTADALFKQTALPVEVDMFERLPVPFGLVRSGVAPDHQKIKRAALAYERTAADPRFRLLANVEVGRDISVSELQVHYDQIVLATGSATDRRLGIPGEDLQGSHPATEFVGWYNAHPDFAGHSFDLNVERAVIVGIGNVALDVTRLLVRKPSELAPTDVAGYALDALQKSQVREVVLLGRRGPAQAAFDLSELSDIAELDGVSVHIDPVHIEQALAETEQLDSPSKKKLAYMAELSAKPAPQASRRVRLEFLASPVELIGRDGRVQAVKVEKNQLVLSDGSWRAQPTGQHFVIDAGLVFRSIGYHGIAIPGVPFDARAGTIPNRKGRVSDSSGNPLIGLYVVGWIKRGPTGVIGTNKPDAQETVRHMLEDAKNIGLESEPEKTREAVGAILANRNIQVADMIAWRLLDELEKAQGAKLGKIRDKFSSVPEMLAVIAAQRKG